MKSPCNKEPVSKHWANSKGFKTVVAAFFPWTFGLSGCPKNGKKKHILQKLANMIFCQCQHKHRIIHGLVLGKKKMNLKYK